MASLKLAKLPVRTPLRLTINVMPDLHRALERYTECYRETYGDAEKITELIPFMLEAFLASDKEFAKTCKATAPGGTQKGATQ